MAKDAIQLLKDDHDKVRNLLSELAETTERATKTRGDLLKTIQAELKAHTTIEEEIFYPAFKKAGSEKEDEKLFYEAKEEHRAVDKLVLPDLGDTDTNSVEFAGRAKVLKELVEHHADEEEKELFPRARKLLSKDQLMELASRMEQRKEQLLESILR
jgi:hemerythrin-like domain-containing protein